MLILATQAQVILDPVTADLFLKIIRNTFREDRLEKLRKIDALTIELMDKQNTGKFTVHDLIKLDVLLGARIRVMETSKEEFNKNYGALVTRLVSNRYLGSDWD